MVLLAEFDKVAGRVSEAHDRYVAIHELEPENAAGLRFLSSN